MCRCGSVGLPFCRVGLLSRRREPGGRHAAANRRARFASAVPFVSSFFFPSSVFLVFLRDNRASPTDVVRVAFLVPLFIAPSFFVSVDLVVFVERLFFRRARIAYLFFFPRATSSLWSGTKEAAGGIGLLCVFPFFFSIGQQQTSPTIPAKNN